MKKLFLSILLGFVIAHNGGVVSAATVSIVPNYQTVVIGTPVDVVLAISGLGDNDAPSLGVFDLDVNFDPTILHFDSVMYGDDLDLFGFGSDTSTIPGTGVVNLFELSFDSPPDLDTMQPGSFQLARLTFNTIGQGNSMLGIDINSLGDALGDPLVAITETGNINVVPVPSALLLMGSGLTILIGMRRSHISSQ
jgi:hypothetical protein